MSGRPQGGGPSGQASPRPGWLDRRLAERAVVNCRAVAPLVIGPRVLDVGAAEGWGAEALGRDDPGLQVTLLDVLDLNRTALPLVVYDGWSFPFPDETFDTVLVMLTLHHCLSPEHVLSEAIRVARKRVIVSESVYRFRPGRWLLWAMDNALNGIRSRGRMAMGLHFARPDEWRRRFQEQGVMVIQEQWISKGVHRHLAFALEKRCPGKKVPWKKVPWKKVMAGSVIGRRPGLSQINALQRRLW